MAQDFDTPTHHPPSHRVFLVSPPNSAAASLLPLQSGCPVSCCISSSFFHCSEPSSLLLLLHHPSVASSSGRPVSELRFRLYLLGWGCIGFLVLFERLRSTLLPIVFHWASSQKNGACTDTNEIV